MENLPLLSAVVHTCKLFVCGFFSAKRKLLYSLSNLQRKYYHKWNSLSRSQYRFFQLPQWPKSIHMWPIVHLWRSRYGYIIKLVSTETDRYYLCKPRGYHSHKYIVFHLPVFIWAKLFHTYLSVFLCFCTFSPVRFRFYQKYSDMQWAIDNFYLGPGCLENCRGHGDCLKEQCICDPGYSGPNCYLTQTLKVILLHVLKSEFWHDFG